MKEEPVYEELANHLNKALVGVPPAPAQMKILKILFPPEEASIAAKLPFGEMKLVELKESFPEVADSLGEILDRMARRGTVFKSSQPGEEPGYRLLPSIVGFTETPFWSGKDTEEARMLAPLWIQYLEEAFGKELARGAPLVRVIPIDESLEDKSQVLPYDVLKEKVDEASFIAVAHCPCRQMRRYEGEGCEHSLENCLHFGSMGRYMVEHGMGREIGKEETLKLLREATEEGLVHLCDNYQGKISVICNCCPCCCVFIRSKRLMGLEALSRSNYVAHVNSEECIGCGTCEDRCPVSAVVVGNDEVAEVALEKCIGCGVCTPTCDNEAIALLNREEIKPPPELVDFVTSRLPG